MINVHIAEDHKILVEAIIPAINNSGIACVTGYSLHLADCRKAMSRELPDVLLLDINMPDGNGILFCSEMHKQYPKLKIIALTGRDEYSSVMMMMKNGALGYIIKSEAVSELLEAIQAVTNGETYISHQMEQMMRKTTRLEISLTRREKEVLELVAQGLSTHQIAEKMGVAESTVTTFRKKLILKFGVSGDRPVELINKARKEGLIE